jgi:spore photoproduct lyase
MPWEPKYSHIYVEDGARNYPMAKRVLAKFPKAKVVAIEDYKQAFNRPAQDFHNQKQSPKLVLAKKKDNFVYPGSHYVQNHWNPNFHYVAQALNCTYDCAYCYLQGMYNSANQVLFVNLGDYFASTRPAIKSRKDPARPFYLCISYDTDLLAFESVAPFAREWIRYASENTGLEIELRTKSANFHAISDLPAEPSTILAWSLSPKEVVEKYEYKTPSLDARLRSLTGAISAGWKVRICIDPILPIPNWQKAYGNFVDTLFSKVDPAAILDIHLGVFRMNSAYFQNIRKRRPPLDLYYRDWEKKDGAVTHPEIERKALSGHLMELLKPHLPNDKLVVWEG